MGRGFESPRRLYLLPRSCSTSSLPVAKTCEPTALEHGEAASWRSDSPERSKPGGQPTRDPCMGMREIELPHRGREAKTVIQCYTQSGDDTDRVVQPVGRVVAEREERGDEPGLGPHVHSLRDPEVP